MSKKLNKARVLDVLGGTSFKVEIERVHNVVLKLARGHMAFELNEPQLDKPSNISFASLSSMPQETREQFEPLASILLPEVGSRAMQRVLTGADIDSRGWVVVQPERYRYCTYQDNGAEVRMVLREYLACEVVWSF